jgi:hypothetical protein
MRRHRALRATTAPSSAASPPSASSGKSEEAAEIYRLIHFLMRWRWRVAAGGRSRGFLYKFDRLRGMRRSPGVFFFFFFYFFLFGMGRRRSRNRRVVGRSDAPINEPSVRRLVT